MVQRKTLIRHLLDELDSDETDYSDALAPTFRIPNESPMGVAILAQPATAEEVRSMMSSLDANISDLRDRVVQLSGAVNELADVISDKFLLSGTANSHHDNSASSSLSKQQGLTIGTPPHHTAPLAIGATSTNDRTSIDTDRESTTIRVAGVSPFALSECSTPSGPDETTGRTEPNGSRAGIGHRRTLSRSLPTAGLFIPNVPVRNPDWSRRPKSESWRDIVRHWTEGAPELSLHTPLRDWPPEWTRGNNRLFATKYHQRSLIALDFLNTFQSDETRFLAAYPEATKGHTSLINAINAAREARGERETRSRRCCGAPP